MQPIIDASTPVYDPAGTKRAASTALPCESSCTVELQQPTPQHDSTCNQACLCKRRRTSNQGPSMNTQSIWQNRAFKTGDVRNQDHEPSNPGSATPNIMTEAATSLTSTQDSASASDERIRQLGNRNELKAMEKAIEDLLRTARVSWAQQQEQPSARAPPQAEETDTLIGGRMKAVGSCSEPVRGSVGPPERRLGHGSKGHSRIHNFYTQASILTPSGISRLERVRVDERSSFNLLPRSIMVAHHLVETNQYCRFTIRVAGIDRKINAGVTSGLQTILLGRGWMQSVNLKTSLDNHNYYILVPLAVEAVKSEFSDISDAGFEVQESEEVEATTSHEIGEEYSDNERYNVDRGDDGSSEGEISSGNECSSDDDILSDLPSGELSSDGENSLDGDPAADECSSDDDTLSELSSGELSSDGENLLDGDPATDELSLGHGSSSEGEVPYGNEEDYESYEGKECEGCEDCEVCENCEDCECGGCDSNLQDIMEQHEHFELQCAKEARDITKQAPEPKHDESIEGLAFDMSCQQSEHKRELVSTADSQPQSAMPSTAQSQPNGVQASITKRQAKDLANILSHISRTQAGQSFKAPVEQLWPDYAEAYAAKIPNPIDLGTIETKVKNNTCYSMDDFRADVLLLYQNSVNFNGIDHIITSAALEVRDTVLKAISDMEEGKGGMRASPRGL